MAEPQETDKQFAGEPSSALKASTSESTTGSTTIIPFDGKGGDPTTLVDREVQCYYEIEEPTRLEFKYSDGRLQFHKEGVTENWDLGDDDDDDDHEVCMDEKLQALDLLRGKQGKKLKLLEAVTGQRKSEVCGILGCRIWEA